MKLIIDGGNNIYSIHNGELIELNGSSFFVAETKNGIKVSSTGKTNNSKSFENVNIDVFNGNINIKNSFSNCSFGNKTKIVINGVEITEKEDLSTSNTDNSVTSFKLKEEITEISLFGMSEFKVEKDKFLSKNLKVSLDGMCYFKLTNLDLNNLVLNCSLNSKVKLFNGNISSFVFNGSDNSGLTLVKMNVTNLVGNCSGNTTIIKDCSGILNKFINFSGNSELKEI